MKDDTFHKVGSESPFFQRGKMFRFHINLQCIKSKSSMSQLFIPGTFQWTHPALQLQRNKYRGPFFQPPKDDRELISCWTVGPTKKIGMREIQIIDVYYI